MENRGKVNLLELEKMLEQAGGTAPLISEAKAQGLGLFIRSLVGLDREAAVQAFGEWLQGSTATPNQIEFIELIIQELTQNGSMDPARLFESPYKDISAQGPLGIFPPTQVTRIVGVLKEIQERAAA